MIAGAPAAGKGTQCQKIVDKVALTPHSSFGWPSHVVMMAIGMMCTAHTVDAKGSCAAVQFNLVHISAGDLLRAEVASGSEAGKKAESFMSQGYLVPNELGIVETDLTPSLPCLPLLVLPCLL